MAEEIVQLFPASGTQRLKIAEIYEDLEQAGRGYLSRPYVFINMISSLDGRASMEGKASGMGTSVDRLVMRTLRSRADAVMIGAGTLRAEKLSLGLDALGAGVNPLAVIVSGTGDVPLESNLLRYTRQRILLLLADSVPEVASSTLAHDVEVVRIRTGDSGGVDLREAIRFLKSDYAVDRLLVEGGPTLNHALISARLADEVFLTLAPSLVGTSGPGTPAILEGPLRNPQSLRLQSAYLAGEELFLRYALSDKAEPDYQ